MSHFVSLSLKAASREIDAALVRSLAELRVPSVALWSVDDDNSLSIQAVAGNNAAELRNIVIPRGGGICGLSSELNESILDNKVKDNVRHLRGIDLFTRRTTTATICVPVAHRGQQIGILQAVEQGGRRQFGSADVAKLEEVAKAIRPSAAEQRLGILAADFKKTTPLLQHERLRQPYESPLRVRQIEAAYLFVDLVGATELNRRIGNQRFSMLLADFYSVTQNAVQEKHGAFQAIVYDEISCFFEDQSAQFSGVARAIQVAELLKTELARLGRQHLLETSLLARYGIAYGKGEIHEIGDRQQSVMILGEGINSAKKTQLAALPNQVLLAESARGFFSDLTD